MVPKNSEKRLNVWFERAVASGNKAELDRARSSTVDYISMNEVNKTGKLANERPSK